uniref:LysM domain-containing protein n=1 Tax=Myoviridae sp. ctJ2i1 TaxID=2825079 RepID=A0A8S5V1Q5_9CAUD|nr:MAG TPA: hypothetical protein [Myoviridae sp. ctJ2i1]
MKKQFATILTAVVVMAGATAYIATPTAPERYVIHTVSYGETLESIIQDSNKNTDVNYDIREATATAVAKSKEMEGGATSRQLKVGDRVAVPIYR